MKQEIQLGDKVKCIYTGFIGIAVARTQFINGCIQYSVLQKWDKKSSVIETIAGIDIDEGSLEVVMPKKKKKVVKESGGPSRKSKGLRGY